MNIHRDLTYRMAIEVGFKDKEAKAIADANVKTDASHHKEEKGRHFNRNILWRFRGGTSQRKWAETCLAKATANTDLQELGRGLHSIQDEITHSRLFGYGLHWFSPIWRGHKLNPLFDPDTFLGLGRLKKLEEATRTYLQKYLASKDPTLTDSIKPPRVVG